MDSQTNQFCEVAGYQSAYQHRGEGETILLVHGITIYAFICRGLFSKLIADMIM